MAAKSKRDLNPKAFRQQFDQGRTREYRDQEVVYSQGSPSAGVFYIRSGIVTLTMVSERRGRQGVLAVLKAGDFFGEDCLRKRTRRMSTATSIGASTITCMETGIFRQAIGRETMFAAAFIKYLLTQNARLKADLADHFFNSSEKRLARILLMHVSLAQGVSSNVRFSQATLAEMVGTTRGRVNKFMNQFKRKGYIRYSRGLYNGSLEIDAKRLATFLQP